MRIAWLCNAPVRAISEALGRSCSVNSGWLDGAFGDVMSTGEHHLCIFYPQAVASGVEHSSGHGFEAYGFAWGSGRTAERKAARGLFVEVLKSYRPDVVHIFGSENEFGEDMVEAARDCDLLERTVVSIQGLVSVYSRQFMPGFSKAWLKRRTLSELKNHCSLYEQRESYRRRGQSEERLISSVHHIIGRTRWDEGCCRLINPSIEYHHVGESLRSEFYASSPSRDAVSHRLYFSQGVKPIKAMYRLVEALPAVAKRVPDVKVIVAGSGGLRTDPLRGTTYDRYLTERMDYYGVRERFEFVGSLGPDEVIVQMASCSAFVSTSSIENSPNSMGEAMMMGLPCVATFVGGVPDIAEHGREALLVPFNETELLADALIRVLTDESLAGGLANAGRKRALLNHSRIANRDALLGSYARIASCGVWK